MSPPLARRWSVEPLLDKCAWDCPFCGMPKSNGWTQIPESRVGLRCESVRHAARRMDVHDKAIHRARREGVTDRQAEMWAQRLGMFPHEIWGWEWYGRVLRELELREAWTELRAERTQRIETWIAA